ncbi:unnamed protein product [Psylliodes chrysocephalus]|uniref:Uncharacterized protein n=1 Tax=Psylliodes chrysocephalus TaxID=3402493 RepID=A0A9P0CYP8_9CUCU|nr:unnamed protein product [Psylliodes chrysocephala]
MDLRGGKRINGKDEDDEEIRKIGQDDMEEMEMQDLEKTVIEKSSGRNCEDDDSILLSNLHSFLAEADSIETKAESPTETPVITVNAENIATEIANDVGLGTVKTIYKEFFISPKRRAILNDQIDQLDTYAQGLKPLCQTRWIERFHAVDDFIELFNPVPTNSLAVDAKNKTMNNRGKRLVQLALEKDQSDTDGDDEYKEDPFYCSSDDDPVYIPQYSSDDFETDTESDNDYVAQQQYEKKNSVEEVEGDFQTLLMAVPNNKLTEPVIEKVTGLNRNDPVTLDLDVAQEDPRHVDVYDISSSTWGPPQGNQLIFEETFHGGISPEYFSILKEEKPTQYFLAKLNEVLKVLY